VGAKKRLANPFSHPSTQRNSVGQEEKRGKGHPRACPIAVVHKLLRKKKSFRPRKNSFHPTEKRENKCHNGKGENGGRRTLARGQYSCISRPTLKEQKREGGRVGGVPKERDTHQVLGMLKDKRRGGIRHRVRESCIQN